MNRNNSELSVTILFVSVTTWSFVVYSLISVLGIFANILLLLAIFKDPLKCFHDVTSIFIINMSLSDLVNLLFVIEEVLLSMTSFGNIHGLPSLVFRINWSAYEFTAFLTYPSLLVLSLERSLAIICPLWHRVHITRSVCYVWLTIVLLLCALYTGVNAVYLEKGQLEIAKYVLTLPTVCFSVSSLALSCVSCMLIQKQRWETRNNHSISEIHRHSIEARLKNHKQFLLTVFILNIGLVCALIPSIVITYYIDTNTELIRNPSRRLLALLHVTNILLLLNFGANPLIYIWRLQKYRKTFLVMYGRRFYRNATI